MVLEEFIKPGFKALVEDGSVIKGEKPLKKLAYVGTPCQIQAFRKAQLFDSRKAMQEWYRRVKLSIALFCTESFHYDEIVKLAEEKGRDIAEIKKWDIKGKLIGYTGDGKFTIPLKKAKKRSRENCHYCIDYSGELADISIGAVGSDKGWNTVIVRTGKGKDVVEGAMRQGYLEARELSLSEKGIKLLKKLVRKNYRAAWKNKKKKEERVPHLDTAFERDMQKLLKLTTVEERIDELLRDVVDPGLCVSCGACETSCAEEIIKMDEEGMPYKLRDCKSTDCGLCYALCPRTTLPIDLMEEEVFGTRRYLFEKQILGQYIKLYAARARDKVMPEGKAQDGGATSAILKYALDKGIVDASISVAQGDKPWYPVPHISVNDEDLKESAGTIYSSAPTITAVERALNQHEMYSQYFDFLKSRGLLPELEVAKEEASKVKEAVVVEEVDREEIRQRREKIEQAISKLSRPKVKMLMERGKRKAIEAIVEE